MPKIVKSRVPYTGPSQVVTTDHDEMQTALWVYVHVGEPSADVMVVHDALDHSIGMDYLRRDKYPQLHAVLMLLKDDKNADARYRLLLEIEAKGHKVQNKLPRHHRISMKLGEIAVIEPELAEQIRVRLKDRLFNNLRGNHAKLFQD